MKLAEVSFARGDAIVTATLTDSRWECDSAPAIGAALDIESPLSAYGPADGDPVLCAAGAAAARLHGRVVFVRFPDEDGPGTVY